MECRTTLLYEKPLDELSLKQSMKEIIEVILID